jgi:hypothetical protein
MLTYADDESTQVVHDEAVLAYADVCRRIRRMPTYSDVCGRMLAYADDESTQVVHDKAVLAYADVCWRMPTYAGVC